MLSSLVDLISVITIILLLIFSAFLLSYKKGNKVSHKILAAFLLSNSIFILDFIYPKIEIFFNLQIDMLNGLGYYSGFLFGPLLFLYTKSVSEINFKLKKIHLSHFLLFVFMIIASRILGIINTSLLVVFLHLQTFLYMYACLKKVSLYNKEIKNYYSSVEMHSLSWLMIIIYAFFFMWLVDLLFFSLYRYDNKFIEYQDYFNFVSLSINFIFASLIIYKGLTHSYIFSDKEKRAVNKKYQNSLLRDSDKEIYANKLVSLIEKEKPYLQPGLTLGDIAEKLDIHPKYLSQVINEHLRKNFHDFINHYRIEEAKRQIKESMENKKTILEVVYECGFNTKSAFNSSFKKTVGLTPTEYRLSLLK